MGENAFFAALVLLMGMDQHQAQGTTLAMLPPPVGLLAAGADLSVRIPTTWLEKIFAMLLIALGVRMLFRF